MVKLLPKVCNNVATNLCNYFAEYNVTAKSDGQNYKIKNPSCNKPGDFCQFFIYSMFAINLPNNVILIIHIVV